jgi:hypothetical protein
MHVWPNAYKQQPRLASQVGKPGKRAGLTGPRSQLRARARGQGQGTSFDSSHSAKSRGTRTCVLIICQRLGSASCGPLLLLLLPAAQPLNCSVQYCGPDWQRLGQSILQPADRTEPLSWRRTLP